MKFIRKFWIVPAALILSGVYLYPVFSGLILLPLDLLLIRYSPWISPGTILLKNPYMQDSISQMYPWKQFLVDSLSRGVIPWWNPYQQMGMPFMASLKPMLFYPLNILLFFDKTVSWNLFLMTQLFLSLIFCYMLIRNFGFGKLISLFAAVTFAFSSLMVGVLEFGSEGHVLMWTPLFFLLVKKFLDTGRKSLLGLAGIILPVSIFGGQLQYTGYVLILLVIFSLYYVRASRLSPAYFGKIILMIVLGVGITAIQIIPSYEMFTYSSRGVMASPDVFNRGLMEPYKALRLFSPDFFGSPKSENLKISYIETSGYFGIIAFLFACFAYLEKNPDKILVFFRYAFIISVLLSFKGTGNMLSFFKIPLITSGSGDRIFSLVLFSGSVLSAYGLKFLLTSGKFKKVAVLSGLFCLFYGFSIINEIYQLKLTGSDTDLFLKNIRLSVVQLSVFWILLVLWIKVSKSKFTAGVFTATFILFLYADLFIFGYRFLTFSNPKFLYPKIPVINYINQQNKNSLVRSSGLTLPDISTVIGEYSVETYNPFFLNRSGNLIRTLLDKDGSQASIDNKSLVETGSPKTKNALDFLGVSLYVAPKDTNPSVRFFGSTDYENIFGMVYQDDRYSVFRPDTYLPRYNLYYEAKVITDNREILKCIREKCINFRDNIIVEKPVRSLSGSGLGNVELISSDLNSQKFQAETDRPAVFYISDTYYPGWRAYVNSKPAEIIRANYNFRAVEIPSGKSVIDFEYLPSNLYYYLTVSFGSLLMLGLFVILPFPAGKIHIRKIKTEI